MTQQEPEDVEITFETPGQGSKPPVLRITGAHEKLLNQPEKIKQLMDLLELPQGTNARIVYRASDVIVR